MAKGTSQTMIAVGRLGADPEITEKEGLVIAKLRIATTDLTKKKDQEGYDEITTWLPITTFRKNAEFCRDYLKKGASVYIEAKFRNRKWEDKDGKTQYSFDFVAHKVEEVGRRKNDDTDNQEKQAVTAGDGDDFLDDVE